MPDVPLPCQRPGSPDGALDLDRVADRAAFLVLVNQVVVPLLTIVAEPALPKVAQEMAAIAALPAVHRRQQPGTLGQVEAFAELVAAAILDFWPSQETDGAQFSFAGC